MQAVKKKLLEELYELYGKRFNFMKEHMEYSIENIDHPKALEAYKNSLKTDEAIENKADEISKETDVATSIFLTRLMDAVFPKALSRYIKCCEVCGLEVLE
ncbi:MAG: hypothetical protein IJV85_01300 [Clostridia bacterium]|nr:hypothetical protein [Clostridia bacterium]